MVLDFGTNSAHNPGVGCRKFGANVPVRYHPLRRLVLQFLPALLLLMMHGPLATASDVAWGSSQHPVWVAWARQGLEDEFASGLSKSQAKWLVRAWVQSSSRDSYTLTAVSDTETDLVPVASRWPESSGRIPWVHRDGDRSRDGPFAHAF